MDTLRVESGESIRFEQRFDATAANIDTDLLVSESAGSRSCSSPARHWQTRGSRRCTFLALVGKVTDIRYRRTTVDRVDPVSKPGQ